MVCKGHLSMAIFHRPCCCGIRDFAKSLLGLSNRRSITGNKPPIPGLGDPFMSHLRNKGPARLEIIFCLWVLGFQSQRAPTHALVATLLQVPWQARVSPSSCPSLPTALVLRLRASPRDG